MTSTKRFRICVEESSESLDDVYLHDLQMYQNVPFGEILFEELREISRTRLKVLALVERIHLQKLTMPISQRKAALVDELRKEGINEFASLISSCECESQTTTDIHARQRDHISHFMLRCAFAFNARKKLWFFKQETRLFKWRFSSLNSKGIRHFMCINNFNFIPISEKEKKDIEEYLETCSSNVSDIANTQFYKVPFSHVISLVKKRKVFIMHGEAFIPEKEMVYVFASYFKKILISSLESARETRANLYYDERATSIFAYLENYINMESTILVQEKEIQQYVSLNRLDELSESSYPLCMKVLHKTLRRTHHLTHGGRVQYGLFLKGIGISLSDAMIFWKNEFTKIMNETIFSKEHSYQIKFIFGLKGSQRDYQPYACRKILESIVGPRDYHGCPFKHMPHDILEDELADCGFNASERSIITDLSSNGQYFTACNKYYELKYDCFNDTFFKHPNIYFNESVKRHIIHHDVDPETGDGY